MRGILEIVRKFPCGTLTAIVILGIGWLTLSPSPAGEIEIPLFDGADKIIHEGMFFTLALTAGYEAVRKFPRRIGFCASGACLLSAGYGILIEYLQDRMRMSRSFEAADIAADVAGSIGGAFILLMIEAGRNRKNG